MKSTQRSHNNCQALPIVNCLIVILIILMLTGVQPVSAAPPSIHYYVDRIDDGTLNSGCLDEADTNTCQLRGAINLANVGSQSYYHHIHLPGGTYTLTLAGDEDANATGDLDIYHATTIIEGAGMDQTVITQGDISQRIFDHRGDDGLKLITLTVSGGRLASGHGAGIYSHTSGSMLTLQNVKVTDNRVTGSADDDVGGGIYLYNTHALITGSIISVNWAEQGAGIYIINTYDGPTTTIEKSAIVDNYADGGNGGGLWAGENSRLELENVTIADNRADDPGMGGGIYIYDNLAANLNHVTVANNWASFLGDEVAGEYSVYLQAYNSIFYYVFGNDVCYYPAGTAFIIGASHTITNQTNDNWCHIGSYPGPDPLLGELGYHRSTTPVIPLLSGSPAIDYAVVSDPVVSTDQRGKPRSPTEPDAGAYEVCEEYLHVSDQ